MDQPWASTEAGFRAYLVTHRRSESTAKTYAGNARLFSRWCDDHETSIFEVSSQEVDLYLADVRRRRAPNIAPLRLTCIRAFYEYCRYARLRDDDPTKGQSLRWQEPLPKIPLEREELCRLMEACRSERDRAMIFIGYSCGLRVSEVVGLQAHDIDFRRKLLTIHGKGGTHKSVPTDDDVLSALRPFVARGPLWWTKDGGPMSVKRAQRNMEAIAKRAGVPTHWHQLRTTFANDALDAGVPIEELRVLMRHKNIETTIHYAGHRINERAFDHGHNLHLGRRLMLPV